ncbi:MAG: TraB/GumN family protein [Bacteroidetes bacterium]|nr:MAG: TraB/GumN family protein [Bacteroidota bacterium]
MKKNNILLCLLMCFLYTNYAYPQEKWINSVFWEVSGKNIKKNVYILGTHHLYKSDFIEKNPIILEKLRKSEAMVGEMIFNLPQEGQEMDTEQAKQMTGMIKAMSLEQKTLKDFLSEKEFADTEKVLKETMGMPLNIFLRMKPIVIYQYIMIGKYLKSENREIPQMGQAPESMDIIFQQEAKKLKKELIGLETLEEQMNVLYDGYTLERQIELLKSIVYEKKDQNSSSDVQKLTNLYKSQDINEMEEMVAKESNKEEYNILLKNRNLNWIAPILKLIEKKKSFFIAVGAAHLGGEFGVLNLLKKEGYTIKPLTIKID